MARKYDTLDAAKTEVDALLRLANNDADVVYQTLRNSNRIARQYDGYTTDDADDYAMLRLALSDLTGNAAYRF